MTAKPARARQKGLPWPRSECGCGGVRTQYAMTAGGGLVCHCMVGFEKATLAKPKQACSLQMRVTTRSAVARSGHSTTGAGVGCRALRTCRRVLNVLPAARGAASRVLRLVRMLACLLRLLCGNVVGAAARALLPKLRRGCLGVSDVGSTATGEK